MHAETINTRLLNDQEMTAHLEKGDTLRFKGLGREWQQIEDQVERLGFGDQYVVSRIGAQESCTKVGPLRARSSVT